MKILRGSLEYQILDECKCGPEEFFVLASSIEEEHLDAFLQALVALTGNGLLKCDRGSEGDLRLAVGDLERYVEERRAAGENLDEHPVVCREFRFTTTDRGIERLLPEDRPLVAQ